MNSFLRTSLVSCFMAAAAFGTGCAHPRSAQKSENAPAKDTTVTVKKAAAQPQSLFLSAESAAEVYISGLYRAIDFGKDMPLPYDVFKEAMHGYLNLKAAGELGARRNIISIADFNLPSDEKRLWIIDLAKKAVLFNTFVAHGQGSGGIKAENFSNQDRTHESSLGFYVTDKVYQGKHGTSLQLRGMDKGFNDEALNRKIVVHGAPYVSSAFIKSHKALGRSWGCPAVPQKLSLPIIKTIKDGSCLFIAHNDPKYAASSHWLTKQITDFTDTLKTKAAPQSLVLK